MSLSSGEIKFIVFYIAFLGLIIFLSSTMDVTIIENLSDEQINILKSPPQFTIDVFQPLATLGSIYNYIQFFFTLLSISVTYQLLAIITTALTIVFSLILIKIILEGIPFL